MLYDRTLIQIRERSFLDLLDLSLYVVRARPVVLGLTALAGIAPWAALNYWLLSEPDFPRMAGSCCLILEAALGDGPADLGPGRSDVRRASAGCRGCRRRCSSAFRP